MPGFILQRRISTMRMCASCLARESEPPGPEALVPFLHLQCCNECICSDCLAPAISTYIESNFLQDLYEDTFIYCPMAPCRGKLSISTVADLAALYRAAGVHRDLDVHLGVFNRALALRASMRAVSQEVTADAAYHSHYVQNGLHRAGVARHILTDKPEEEDEKEVVEFASLFVDDCQPMDVPIITSLFYQRAEVRTCSVCAEELRDAYMRFPDTFERMNNRDYRGNLHFFTERFPSHDTLPACAAAHALDICKACIGQHIHAHLEERGASAIGSIQCPSPGCEYVYGPNEIRLLTGAATLEKYQHLSLVRTMGDEPNFRWCVRPSCGSGAIYDASPGCCHPGLHPEFTAEIARALGADLQKESRVVCWDCEQPMCFDCQVEWHKGLSCEEYSALRARGDGSAETEAWLRGYTKRCPGEGCGSLIEKGNACFHMTCSKCRHEFCWECLADWKKIFPREGYNVDAHNEGCFFRFQDAIHPSFMHGRSIETARPMAGMEEEDFEEEPDFEEEDDQEADDDDLVGRIAAYGRVLERLERLNGRGD